MTTGFHKTRSARSEENISEQDTDIYYDPAIDDSFLSDMVGVLRRRRYWLLSIAISALVISLIIAKCLPNEYDAIATIRISDNNSNSIQLDDTPVASVIGGDEDEKLETEMSVLTSRSLALDVANMLDLYSNPVFSKPGKNELHSSAINPLSTYRILAAFRDAVTVYKVPHTQAICISVRTRSPKLSAEISNTLVNEYIERNYQMRFKSQEGVSDWLTKQLDDLRKQMEAAQEKTLIFQKRLGLLNVVPVNMGSSDKGGGSSSGGGTETLAVKRIEGLEAALINAQSDHLVKEATYNVLASSNPSVIPALPNSVLGDLRKQQSSLASQLKQLTTKYGPNYQRVREATAQLAELSKEVNKEQTTELARAKAEMQVSAAAEQSLKAAVDHEKEEAERSNDDIIQYTIANREFESSYMLYEGLLAKLKEAGVLAGLRSSDVDIIDAALIPLTPSAPRTSLFLLSGLGVGLIGGLLTSFIMDAMDKSILSGDLLEQITRVPTFGVIPKNKVSPAERQLHGKPSDRDGVSRQQLEAYQSLRTTFLLSHIGIASRSVLISSSIPAEGKSTVAMNLAFTLAQRGSKILLLDCDLRRPSLATRLGLKDQVGLTTMLTKNRPMTECVQTLEGVTGLDVLVSGPLPPNPLDLLGSKPFADLLERAKSQYDFVIMDSPPVLSVSDGVVIAALADDVLFVTRSGSTTRYMVESACRTLRRAGASILGGVLNAIDYRSDEYAHYGYNNYYTDTKGQLAQEGSGL